MTQQLLLEIAMDIPEVDTSDVEPEDITWRDMAACRTGDPYLHLTMVSATMTPEQENDAKAYCRSCPVTFECLAYGLSTGSVYGIFGGMTWAERRRWRRKPENREQLRRWVELQQLDVEQAKMMGR